MHITDAHVHIFPAQIALKAADAIGGFYGGIKMWGNGTVEMVKENCKRAGIDRCFVHSVATAPRQVKSINDFIASSVKASDGLFIGFATMHPDFEDMAGELDRALEMGLKGVKLHPDMQSFAIDDPRAMKLYELMTLRGMPLIAHTGDDRYDYSNPERTAHVAREFPELRVQAAHFGGYSCWDRVCDKLAGCGLYADCSSSFFRLDDAGVMHMIRFFGADHVMFGSDYPMWDACRELERLKSLPLEQEELAMILSGTADDFLA